jgi:hypothetical protein
MVGDLVRVCGGWIQASGVTGVPWRTMESWFTGRRQPNTAAARGIWLCWVTICRPGEVKTVYDIATCGRITKRGNPATAGNSRLGKWLSRHETSVTPETQDAGDTETPAL